MNPFSIRQVATIDRDQAGLILTGKRTPLFGDAAWIGFEDDGYPSPLRHANVSCLILRMDDWEPAAWRKLGPCTPAAPSLAAARVLVEFVRARSQTALYVHCYAGLYRSGAVAEWLRNHLPVSEHPNSYRLVCGGAEDRVYNELLYQYLCDADRTFR